MPCEFRHESTARGFSIEVSPERPTRAGGREGERDARAFAEDAVAMLQGAAASAVAAAAATTAVTAEVAAAVAVAATADGLVQILGDVTYAVARRNCYATGCFNSRVIMNM